MLGKLLKYEIPALGRKLLPMYIGWAATAAFLGIAVGHVESKSEFVMVLSGLLYAGATTAIFVMAVILIVQRYKNSLLGDEGYFNHVLPVSASAHIANKTISALVWVLLSGVALCVTGIIIAVFSGDIAEIFNMDFVREFFRKLFGSITFKGVLATIEFIIACALSIVKSVLAIYAALTIGHQARERTTLASIGAYFGVLTFESLVGRVLMLIVTAVVPEDIYEIMTGGLNGFMLIMLGAIVVETMIGGVYFYICKDLMEKRLNLA